ncbi:MAG: hypothetical protein ACI8S6_005023, partial [Myxococcota bacterium]
LAQVTLKTADGARHTLQHGDLIGRLWTARLQLSDPRVSEAHAMISLRGGQLKLLALRGLFAIDGKPRKDIVLAVGQRIAFARDLEVEVIGVSLPVEVMGLSGADLPRQPLPGACFLVLRPNPALVSRPHDGHVAAFWSTGDGWLVRLPGQPPEELTIGWSMEVEGQRFSTVHIGLSQAGQSRTHMIGAVSAPMRLELHWDTAYIHRTGLPTLTLRGHHARLLSELASVGTAVSWEHLAALLWRDEVHRDRLRRRFDTVLTRLRSKLRDGGVSPDLISFDGSGNLALVLRPEDTIDDRS